MRLVIDSATSACSVALIEEDRVLDERHEIVGRGHAERLLPMIEEVLKARKPNTIAVDCGPGSFTGIRVGIAAAHGLAIGWGVPLVGYSSLALMAGMAEVGRDDKLAAAMLGGHGQIFVQSYSLDPFLPLDEMQSLYPAEAAEKIDASTVVGSGAEILIQARGGGKAIDMLPRAAAVRHLPASLLSLDPRPVYGRMADAKPMT